MKRGFVVPLSAIMLAVALAVSMSVDAHAKSEGHGKHGRGHSFEARGGGRSERRDGDYRGSASHESRDYGRRGSGSGGWFANLPARTRYRDGGDGYRSDTRWRDGSRRSYEPTYRSRTYSRYRDYPVYRSRTYYGRSYPTYRSRSYYCDGFYRPRYLHRSGFNIGFVIASAPSYGYTYYDPYCDIRFSSLDPYYDHCCAHDHPDVILVADYASGYPIGSCVYSGGDWVVDDCN